MSSIFNFLKSSDAIKKEYDMDSKGAARPAGDVTWLLCRRAKVKSGGAGPCDVPAAAAAPACVIDECMHCLLQLQMRLPFAGGGRAGDTLQSVPAPRSFCCTRRQLRCSDRSKAAISALCSAAIDVCAGGTCQRFDCTQFWARASLRRFTRCAQSASYVHIYASWEMGACP